MKKRCQAGGYRQFSFFRGRPLSSLFKEPIPPVQKISIENLTTWKISRCTKLFDQENFRDLDNFVDEKQIINLR